MSESVELQTVKTDLEATESNISIDSTQAVSDMPEDGLNSIKPPESINEEDLYPDLNVFMTSCRQGNLEIIKESINSKKVKIDDTFSDGITALHWASINGQLEVCKYLISQGIEIDRKGGELQSTSLHWACRNGLTKIVHFLLEEGANPTLFDNQHYNSLQLAVLSSNIMLIIYLLYKYHPGNKSGYELYVDESDKWKRTSLHWACYQGDVLTVQLLIKFGANVNTIDEQDFLPIHWSFTKVYKPILKILIEQGTDIFHKNNMNKNSFEVAQDMDCYKLWIQSLNECGKFEKNNWETKKINEDWKNIYETLAFLTPWILILIFFQINSWNLGFIIPKLFLSILIVAGIGYLLREFIISKIVPDKSMTKSPFSAGIFTGTLFWTSSYYIVFILPKLFFTKYFLLNIILLGLIGSVIYCFYKAMTLNPGLVPVPTDNAKIYNLIEELVNQDKFDPDHFCIESFVRKPIRSRYSRYHKRLVARFDHYCPWVYNEVGVRNHKVFMFFVYSLNLAILIFAILAFKYFDILEDSTDGYDSDNESCFLTDELCLGFTNANFGFNLLLWCGFQFLWITLLTATQLFQILKGLTTYEFTNVMRSHRNNRVATNPITGNPCFKLLGIDQFIMTAKVSVLEFFNKQSHEPIMNPLDLPSDFGFKQNWKDFWYLGEPKFRNIFYLPINGENNLNGELVDYYTLYEFPTKTETV